MPYYNEPLPNSKVVDELMRGAGLDAAAMKEAQTVINQMTGSVFMTALAYALANHSATSQITELCGVGVKDMRAGRATPQACSFYATAMMKLPHGLRYASAGIDRRYVHPYIIQEVATAPTATPKLAPKPAPAPAPSEAPKPVPAPPPPSVDAVLDIGDQS